MANEPNPDIPDLSADSVIPSAKITEDPKAVQDANNALDAILLTVAPKSQEALAKGPGPDDPGPPGATGPAGQPNFPGQGDPKPLAGASGPPAAPPAAAPAQPAAPATPAPSAPAQPAAPTTPTPAASPVSPDDYKAVQLPPYAKPATTEAFERVKVLAGVKIDSLTKTNEELSARVKALEASTGKLPAETEQELNELRTFRKQLDVQYDPSFQEFDKKITQNAESIFAKLKEIKVSDENIAKIKEYGVDKVEWDSILEKLPSNAKRFIEAKLTQNDELLDEKARALHNAKQNADQFLANRDKQWEEETKADQAQVKKDFDELIGQFDWSKRREVAPTATEQEKAATAEHNAFHDKVQAAIADAAEDDSPRMRAILTLGYCRMLALQRELAGHQSALKAQETAWNNEKAALEKTINEQKAFIDRIKRASGVSIAAVQPIPGQTTQPKVAIDEPGAQALDRLLVETTPA